MVGVFKPAGRIVLLEAVGIEQMGRAIKVKSISTQIDAGHKQAPLATRSE